MINNSENEDSTKDKDEAVANNKDANKTDSNNNKRVLSRLQAGDIFGEISFLEGGGASASVVADSDEVPTFHQPS